MRACAPLEQHSSRPELQRSRPHSYTYNLYHLITAVNEGTERARAATRALPPPALCNATHLLELAPARGFAEPPVVVYNNDVSWEQLERVLDEGCFDSGALAGLR